MKARVNEELCIGCGVCESVAPEVFSLENGQFAEVIMNPITADSQAATIQASEDCPVNAIEVENGDNDLPAELITTETEIVEVEESSPIMNSERKVKMRTTVDPDRCIGCGICEGIVPEVFSLLNEPYAEVLLDPVPEEHQEAVREAAEECPESAIAVIEE